MFDEVIKWLTTNGPAIQAVTHIVSILGIPIVIILFFRNTRRDDIARQEKIYDEVDKSYIFFNHVILSHPHLDVMWFDQPETSLTERERTQQYILFDLLTNMFERAFLAYQNAPGKQRKQQWVGWQDYIDLYCKKQAYQDWWFDERHKIGTKTNLTFDQAFEDFIKIRFRAYRSSEE